MGKQAHSGDGKEGKQMGKINLDGFGHDYLQLHPILPCSKLLGTLILCYIEVGNYLREQDYNIKGADKLM